MASASQVGKRTFWGTRAEPKKEGGQKKGGLGLFVGAKPHLFSRHGTVNGSCQSINTRRMTETEWRPVCAGHGATRSARGCGGAGGAGRKGGRALRGPARGQQDGGVTRHVSLARSRCSADGFGMLWWELRGTEMRALPSAS